MGSEKAACSHIRLTYAPLSHDDGSRSESWRCNCCKADFNIRAEPILRARVAELEAKLAESEEWKHCLADDVIRTSHENMELQRKLAAATKCAGEEKPDGN